MPDSPRDRVLRSIASAACVIAGGAVPACEPAPEPFDVVEATIAGIQEAIRDGRTTCVDIVEAYLARIEAYDEARGIHAITEVNPAAVERAAALDRRLAEEAEMGPLFCAPILVKDNFDTHDLPTTGGSIALKGNLPPDDAFMVRRLREADAIVIAKTNMAEWAFSPRETVSSSYGTTANAYAPDRVPAGSSGGTASGVAASFGVAGLGSDTGNSIRGPSAHLALFGIRSTIGLTSRDGVIPLAYDRDIAGPMTRTVEDGARLFDVMAGYDPADPYTELGRGRRAEDYTAFLDPDGLAGARIGVLRALAESAEMDSAVAAVFERALADLGRLGAELVDPFEVPTLQEHRDADGLFCRGFRHDVGRYLASLGEGAPIHDVLEVLEDGRFHERSRRALDFFAGGPQEVAPPDEDPPCPAYPDHPGRQAFLADVVAAMDAADVEAVVYPTWTHPPAHLDRADAEYRGDNSQLIPPATGMPAATVPMGYTFGGLPAGLQILARPYDEGVLFRLAYAYEQGTGHRRPPAGFPRVDAAEGGS